MKQIFTLLIMSASMALSAQNLLTNPSFETWTDGKPDGWYGAKSNIAAANVTESSDAQEGAKSVKLVNADSGHKRFTSQPINLTANQTYTLTYYTKGAGEVRNSFYNGNPDSSGGGYAAYSAYTTVTGDWQQVSYTFETEVDVTGVEIIFSVRNSADGVLIDNASLTQGGVIEVTEVSSIYDLRNGTPGGQLYKLTSDALLTYKIANRNQKYIEDYTGGILIDDVAGKLGNDYNVGDKIAGITGTLNLYNGLLQFIPTETGLPATSTGNAVEYELVSLSNYLANPQAYESEYIAINGLTISDFAGGDGTFQNGKSYPMTDGTQNVEGRTSIYDISIIGQPIPTTPSLVIGFGGRFNETIQVYLTDVTEALGVNDLDASNVSLNTVWNNQAVFVTKGNTTVEIFNLNGQLVQKAQGNNNFSVNVSALTKGVYMVKLTVDGKVSTHKVVKK